MSVDNFDLDKWVMQREVDEEKTDPHDSLYCKSDNYDEDEE